MAEEMYYTTLPDGRSFKCVMSTLWKTKGKCPIDGHMVDDKKQGVA